MSDREKNCDDFPEPSPTLGEGLEVGRNLPPDIPTYRVTRRAGVWTLRRLGRVVMRTSDGTRLDRKVCELAAAEARELGRDVVVHFLDPSGLAGVKTWPAPPAPAAEGGAS